MDTTISKLYDERVNISLNELSYDEKGRYYLYTLSNNNLLSHYSALKAVFTWLMKDKRFIDFGLKKVIIVSALDDEQEYQKHCNVLIDNNTTFEQYYTKIKDIINQRYIENYAIDTVKFFRVLVWNMDDLSNKNIKLTSESLTVNKKDIKTTEKTSNSAATLKPNLMNSFHVDKRRNYHRNCIFQKHFNKGFHTNIEFKNHDNLIIDTTIINQLLTTAALIIRN